MSFSQCAALLLTFSALTFGQLPACSTASGCTSSAVATNTATVYTSTSTINVAGAIDTVTVTVASTVTTTPTQTVPSTRHLTPTTSVYAATTATCIPQPTGGPRAAELVPSRKIEKREIWERAANGTSGNKLSGNGTFGERLPGCSVRSSVTVVGPTAGSGVHCSCTYTSTSTISKISTTTVHGSPVSYMFLL